MWKYVAIWAVNVFWVVVPAPVATPSLDPTNPIQSAYNWATLVSTMTDRALWLLFLFLILAIAWWIDRRKERELEGYRSRVIATLVSLDKLMERLERKLDE